MKPKVLITGTYSKVEAERLAAKAKVLGFDPEVIIGVDKSIMKKHLFTVMSDCDCVFTYYKSYEDESAFFKIERELCGILNVPFFTQDYVDTQLVKYIIGEAVTFDGIVYDPNGGSDNDNSNSSGGSEFGRRSVDLENGVIR